MISTWVGIYNIHIYIYICIYKPERNCEIEAEDDGDIKILENGYRNGDTETG